MNKKELAQIERHMQAACYGMLSKLDNLLIARLKMKSHSNTHRYQSGNLTAGEYRLLQLELLDLASMVSNLNSYCEILNAVYCDCNNAEVWL